MLNESELIISTISQIRDKANSFILSELEACNIKGLIPIHGDILYVLFSHGELSMKDIAQLVNRKKSTVTSLVDKLIILDFVERKQSENDRRSFLISLTADGLALGGDLKKISKNLLDRVYKDMPIKERVSLTNLLRKVNSNL
jgi:DNA-binding MarR family transcriptional regulator